MLINQLYIAVLLLASQLETYPIMGLQVVYGNAMIRFQALKTQFKCQAFLNLVLNPTTNEV